MPNVSIIVPVYNVAVYLKRGLDCLINQTLKDLEFICIDDCSTDKSLEILHEYAKKDKRFKIIALDKNQGAAVARNKGLEIATGEYLGFIDPDDEIDLNYYEELYKKAKEGDYDIVKCLRKNITGDKVIIGKDSDNVKIHGLYGFCFEWTCAIYKASIIFDNNIKFRSEIIKAQDVLFLNEVVLKSKSIALIDNVFYNYYLREGSLNSNKLIYKKLKSAVCAVRMMMENVNNAEIFTDNQNKTDYDYMFFNSYNPLFTLFYKCMDKESQLLCAKEMVEGFHICRDKETLAKNYRYKQLLPFIKEQNVDGLQKYMSKYKDFQDFKNNIKLIDKIFSVKNDRNGYKVIRVLGLKIKIKRSKNSGY